MKPNYTVLILADQSSIVLPSLEQLFAGSAAYKVKFISPQKVYKADFDGADFILLDYEHYLKNVEMLKPTLGYLEKLSIFTTLTDHQQVNDILKETKVCHLFGMSGTHTLGDIKNHLVACIENKFWTPDTFISEPATNRSHSEFNNSDHLDQQIEKALEAHDFTKTFEGFKAILIQILNETLTNALYNAPVDQSGKFLHRHQNRRDVITSDQKMTPTLDIVEDADKIVLGVKDFYGTLTKDVIDHYLTHGEVAEKNGGAGVGMYLILKHAHKMIINIDPGKMTEFIVVLHKFKRFFHYQTLEKSYHLYLRKRT